jgi:AraC-like DNA-binding protein
MTSLVRDHPGDRSARASAFLLAGVLGHLLAPLVVPSSAPAVFGHGLVLLALTPPFAFWLLAHVHFEDDFRVAPRHWALLGFTLIVGYLSWLAARHAPGASFMGLEADVWRVAPKLFALGLIVHALLRVYVGAGPDLDLPRLRLRYLLMAVAGTYMLLEMTGEIVLRQSTSLQSADRLHSALLLAVLFGVSLTALRTSSGVLRPAKPTLDAPAADPAVLERLRRLMEEEAAYREEGLTIRGLADRVGTQEHRLRQLINTQLGFKNFNAFLHHYRIQEAQRALADPARAHLGVAQIAYEAGYRSLATFNKAFKDITGRTPTELRGPR